MPIKSTPEFVILAAVWGGSFLFMRVAAPSFGPFALILARCAIAALVLLPFSLWLGRATVGLSVGGRLRERLAIGFAGVINSAIPFVCFSYAALYLTAGVNSIFNATTPIFGAIVAWIWLHERLSRWRAIGLAIGLAGVVIVSLPRVQGTDAGMGLAVLASVSGAVCYGIAGSYTRRFLTGVDPLRVAAGSQIGAVLALLLPGVLTWPDTMPSLQSWLNVIALGAVSTGLAYLLFFRLIAAVGPSRTLTVTFLIPVFGVLWGWFFLGETLDAFAWIGGLVVLIGTALATGTVDPGRLRSAIAGQR